MKEKITEKDYYLHTSSYKGALEILKKEIKKIKKSGRKTLWYYGGEETLERLKKGTELINKGRNGGLSLTPYDVNNIIHVLLKKLEE